MLLLSLSASPSSFDKRAYNLTLSFVCCFNISAPFQQQTNRFVRYHYTTSAHAFQPFVTLFFLSSGTIFLLDFFLDQPFNQMLQLNRAGKDRSHIKGCASNLDCVFLLCVVHVFTSFPGNKKTPSLVFFCPYIVAICRKYFLFRRSSST